MPFNFRATLRQLTKNKKEILSETGTSSHFHKTNLLKSHLILQTGQAKSHHLWHTTRQEEVE